MARHLFGTFGYDIIRRPIEHKVPSDPLSTLIRFHEINTIIDVGANVGQFGLSMRNRGFDGLIISIEPLTTAFEQLQIVAAAHGPWETHHSAAGDANGIVEINIAGNSESSSILPMARRHEVAAPESRYIGQETVAIRTLDSLFEKRLSVLGNILLKIDVQGFEPQVLLGAARTVDHAVGIMMETSIIPMYEGSICLEDALRIMKSKAFLLSHVERAFWERDTQQLLQLDCIFFKDAEFQ